MREVCMAWKTVGILTMLLGFVSMAPPLSALALVGFVAFSVVTVRAADRRRVACVHCGEPIRPGALVCPHCRGEQE